MKKTSRRSFGKLVTGAIAALPIASVTANSTVKAGSDRKESLVVMQEKKYHENTPPPVEIAEGSFSCSIKTRSATKPLAETGSGTGPFLYKGSVSGSGNNNFETIKILHGSGEWIYRDVEANGSIIIIELQDDNDIRAGTLTISGEMDAFQIHSRGYGTGIANGQLQWIHETLNPHHKHRFSHRGGPGSRDFRVTGIKITKGGATTLNFVLPPVSGSGSQPFESQGYRILIWFRD